jgi:hypothetical protein
LLSDDPWNKHSEEGNLAMMRMEEQSLLLMTKEKLRLLLKKHFHRKCFKYNYFGTPGWDRTNDLRLRSPLLYPLSYRGVWAIIDEN